MRFLETMTANIISGHRKVPPYGLEGGGPGEVGINSVTRSDGEFVGLSGTDQIELYPGDVVTIKTPGGGGYGSIDT